MESDEKTGGAPATGDVMAGEHNMINEAVELSVGWLTCGLMYKAANNPCGVGALFSLVKWGFVPSSKTGGTNSVRMKHGENAAFWIVPDVFVASLYTPVSGGFKYRDSYRLAVA